MLVLTSDVVATFPDGTQFPDGATFVDGTQFPDGATFVDGTIFPDDFVCCR